MGSTPQQAEELRIAGESCKKRFHDLLEASKRRDGYILNVMSERRTLIHSQRYGMWTANVDILETGPHSLDFRLNEKKILRDYVLGILTEISHQVSRVITIATTPQASITRKLYAETSDSSPDVVEEDFKSQEPPLAVKAIYNALADEEEICDEIIRDRLNSLFEIASEIPSNEASTPIEHATCAVQNVQNALTPGHEQPDSSTTGGTYPTLLNPARTAVSGVTTQPGYSVEKTTASEKDRVSMKRLFNTSNRREYHIVILGADGVGKSCLIAQFVQNVWIETYDRTIEDSYRKQTEVDGRQVILEILDTAGEEQSTAMRDLYIKSGQGFLLVFNTTSLSSLDKLSSLHDQIVRIKNDPLTPLVVVGNKCDLKEDRAVSRAKALAVAQSWNAPYYETSARVRTNVDEAFVDLCRQVIRRDVAAEQTSVMETEDRKWAGRLQRGAKEMKKKGSVRRDCVIL